MLGRATARSGSDQSHCKAAWAERAACAFDQKIKLLDFLEAVFQPRFALFVGGHAKIAVVAGGKLGVCGVGAFEQRPTHGGRGT